MATLTRAAARAVIERTRQDPAWFSRRVLGEDLWDTQQAIARAVFAHPQVAVKACHSSGKTRLAANVALAFFHGYATESRIITTAPTWTQVERLLWAEIALLHGRLPAQMRTRLNKTELEGGPGWYALGLSTDDATRFQGHHAQHVLVIFDEAPGVRPAIYEGLRGIQASGDVHVLLIGNPTESSGPFYDPFTAHRERWRTFTIDAFATPNLRRFFPADVDPSVLSDEEAIAPLLRAEKDDPDSLQRNPRPYLTSPTWVLDQWYEAGPQSPVWLARVRGRFPDAGPNQLISLTWLEQSRQQGKQEDDGSEVSVGIDVAGPGEDETVAYVRQRERVLAMGAWQTPDPRGAVKAFLGPYLGRLHRINVDSIGIGYGFYLDLRDWVSEWEKQHGPNPGSPFCVQPVNVGEAPRDSERFLNKRAELWWGMRDRLREGGCCGLTDERTIAQVASIQYAQTPRGQVQIESKQAATTRGVKSPDRADALLLAYAEGAVPGIAEYYRRMAETARAEGR